MKTNYLFSKSFLSTLFFAAIMAFSFDGFAQCNPTFNQGWMTTIPFCKTGTCNSVTVSIPVNPSLCSGLGTPTWKIVSNGVGSAASIEIVSTSQSGTNPIIYSATIRSKPGNNGGNLMKGRLYVTWSGLCGVQAELVRYIDVFKTYTDSRANTSGDADFLVNQQTGGASTEFIISGQATNCVAPNTNATFSVRPLATNPASDEIGQDRYAWSVPSGWTILYYSGDSSAITVRTPSSLSPSSNFYIFVKMGRANTPLQPESNNEHYFSQLAVAPGNIRVNFSNPNGLTFHNINQGFNVFEASACLPADQGGGSNTFNLEVRNNSTNLDPGFPDANYTWSIPAGFEEIVGGVPTGNASPKKRVITVRPRAGSLGFLTGRFTVILASGQCGSQPAAFTINRTFWIAGSPAYNRITPQPTSGDCYQPGQNYTFSVTNAPAGNYTWTFNSSTSDWQIVSGQNTSTVVVRAGTSSPTITVTGPIGCTPAIGCTPCSTSSVVSLSSSGYNVADGADLPMAIVRNTRTLSVENGSGSDWLPSGCISDNFLHFWQFRGERSTNGGTSWISYGTYNTTDGGTWFPTTSAGSGSPIFGSGVTTTAAVSFNPGTYRGLQTTGSPASAQFRVTIRNNPNQNCTGYTCFYRLLEYNLPNATYIPQPGGGADPKALPGGVLQKVNGFSIEPNPNPGEALLKIMEVAEGAKLYIRDASGRVVYTIDSPAQVQTLQLDKLPKGLYQVEYVAPNERMSGKMIVE